MSAAIAKGYIPAATAAAEILGDAGNDSILAQRGAAYSPLALAAQSTDRRLRFAAVNAIMKLKPSAPFAGSSHVTAGLAFFASTYGGPRVLVVHPNSSEAQRIAGLAAALGYSADIATNGRRAFELAVTSSDYEFVLIHSAIDRPRVDELVAQLRRDNRTAALPIGLIAPVGDWDRVERFAYSLPRATAMLQPQKPEELQLFAKRLLALAGRRHVSAAERKTEALSALEWLADISSHNQSVFDVRRYESNLMQVLFVPELSERIAMVLGHLGTAESQRALIELADLSSQPLAARAAAAAAFAKSVYKHGILLTRPELLEQYGLYNSNAGRDPDTNTVLSTILDAIEHKPDSASNRP